MVSLSIRVFLESVSCSEFWDGFVLAPKVQDLVLEESIEIRLPREQKESSGTSVFGINTDFLVHIEIPTILSGRDKLQGVAPRFFNLLILTKRNTPKYHKTYKVLRTYR